MIGQALPVFRGYSSQYGHGLGNVLGGVVRAAIPVVTKYAKKAGVQLVDKGIDYLQNKVLKRKKKTSAKVPAKRRKVTKGTTSLKPLHKKKRPPGKPVSRAKPRTKKDIFDAF